MTAGRIVVVGDVINDIVAVPRAPMRPDTDTPATIRRTSGGSAANLAVWLADRGAEVDLVAAVGTPDAELHHRELVEAGVMPHLQREIGVQTGTIVIVVQGADRSMLTERGANSLLRTTSVTDALLAEACLLHVSGYSILDGFGVEGTRELVARATDAGVPVSVGAGSIGFIADFGVQRFLDAARGATLLFLSAAEACMLSGCDDADAAARMLGSCFPVVAVTLGAEGSLLVVDGAAPVAVPTTPVRSIDPTGAGDAFAAGFLECWLRTGDAVAAAEAGTFLAARAIMVIGGRPPL